ncbi:hypothetical protein TWF481_011983 [Arthrobotrys musiformis]|uniref:Beta-glucuronidase C-terminal domain-containing protein n=1 Tax=Arthrobotrys musiformis TaxID=47236 RepID=A0AAV9VYI7_9PEZI
MGVQSLFTSALSSLFCAHVLFISGSQAQLGNSTVINVEPTLANAASAPTIDRSFIGYSLEHNAIPQFVLTKMLTNIMDIWASKTGGRPGIRLGGTAMDKTTWVPNFTSQAIMWWANPVSEYIAGPVYLTTLKNYFPSDTQITFGLNLVNTTGNWSNAVEFAVAATQAVPQVNLFEIGNEPDLYVQGKVRPTNWVGKDYANEWMSVATQVQAAIPGVRFQPAVFAKTLKDGFDIGSLIRYGADTSQFNIPTYSYHFYAQSACSGNPNLNGLVNHNTLVDLLSRFESDIAAAESVGSRFTLAESNSVSCSGAIDVSDTFASALWVVDYALYVASKNVERVYLHSGPQTPYTPFVPRGNSGLSAGVRPLSYGVYFLAEALALPSQGSSTRFLVCPVSLPGNPSDISAYGLYSNKIQKPNLDVIGTTTRVYTTTSFSTRTIYSTDKLSTGTSVSTKSIIQSVSTSTKLSTSSRIVTVTKTTKITKRTTVRATRTTTSKSRLSNGRTTTRTVKITYWKTTTTTIPSTTKSKSTSKTTITSKIYSTKWTSQRITLTITVTRATPLISTSYSVSTIPKVLTSTDTSATIKPQATDIGNFPLTDGVFLARAVVINLSPYNTSDPSVLNCRSCNYGSPQGYGTLTARASTNVTLTGFQPNHRLKMIKLQGPGLNAKSGINVSGIIFDENSGTLASASVPSSVFVDKTGAVTFRILAAEAVLLLDENVS